MALTLFVTSTETILINIQNILRKSHITACMDRSRQSVSFSYGFNKMRNWP